MYMTNEELWDKIRTAVEETKNGIRLLNDPHVLGLSTKTSPHRMSTQHTQTVINKICKSFGTVNYLEVGVLHGASYFAAAFGNEGTFYGIDNWSKYGNHQTHIEACVKKYESDKRKFKFINHDCWDSDFILPKIENKIDVFFYDGSHEKDPQERSLSFFSPVLSDRVVFIVDDYEAVGKGVDVKSSTVAGIEKSPYACVESFELLNDKSTGSRWHNGLFVGLLERKNE